MTQLRKQFISADDSISIDAFGRWRTSDTGQRFDVEFIYNTQTEITDTVVTGAGTAAHNANSRDLDLEVNSTTNGDEAGVYSYPVPYTPGNSQLIDITGVLDYAAIGGGTTSVFLRTKVSGTVAETTYDQSTWETATSGVDWTKSHIFQIDLQSLKVGRIRFNMVRNGIPVKVKEIVNDNIRNTGYWQMASLPVYWRIYNDATNTYMEMGYGDENNGVGFRYTITANASAAMKAICATVKSEGGDRIFEMAGYNRSIDLGVTSKTVSTSLIPIISIRPRATFNSLPNLALAIPTDIFVEMDNPVRLVLTHDGALTGASWSNVDINESIVEYDTSATAISNGHILWTDYASTSKNIPASIEGTLGRTLLWNRKGTESGIVTLSAIRTSATNAELFAGFRWKEIR